METSIIHFGEALASAENAALRRRITDLWDGLDGPLVVDSVLALHRKVVAGGAPPFEPASYLLFDLQSLFLYQESEGGPARIDSAVRAIVDGYPAQPFDDLDRHFAAHAFRPFLAEEALGVLPHLWARRKVGTLTALHLTTGEIETAEVRVHPCVPAAGRAAPPEPPPSRTDASLRLRSLPDLEGFVSRTVGVVREETTLWGFMSLPVAMAETAWDQGRRREMCFGKGNREGQARAIAVCESLERFQIARHRRDEELLHGTFRELAQENPVDPRDLFFGRSPLCPGDVLPTYDENLPIYWTRAVSPLGGEALVPAQEIWFSAQDLPGESPSIAPTTSGCALGSSFEEAALFALLEAIERDSFLTAWYLRRPARQIDPDSLADESFQILRRRWELEFSDYSLHLFDLTNDTAVPAVGAFGVRRRGRGPKTFMGVAARLSPERACLTALSDVASFSHEMTDTRLQRSLHLLAHPEDITDPSDHGTVFARDEAFARLEFLGFDESGRIGIGDLWRPALIPRAQGYDLKRVLETLARHLETLGVRVYFKDLTHAAVEAAGLRCVKAITPGLFPLWFGARQRRFAATPRLSRLAEAWHLEAPEPVAASFNLEVHPFT